MFWGALAISPARSSLGDIVSRMRGIAWPYLLWGLISLRSCRSSIDSCWLLPRTTEHQSLEAVTGQASWFLWTLFVIEVLILPSRGHPLPCCSQAPVALCYLGQICAFGLWTRSSKRAVLFDGMHCAAANSEVQPASRPQSVVFILVGILLFAMLALMMSMSVDQSELLYLFGGVVGSTATVACTLAIRSAWLKRILQSLGLASLAIFLLHPIFRALELLVRFAKLDPRMHFSYLLGCRPLADLANCFEARPCWLFRLPPRRKVSLA